MEFVILVFFFSKVSIGGVIWGDGGWFFGVWVGKYRFGIEFDG